MNQCHQAPASEFSSISNLEVTSRGIVCELIIQGLFKAQKSNLSQELNIQVREVSESPGEEGVVVMRVVSESNIVYLCTKRRQRSRMISSSGVRYIITMSPRRHVDPLVSNRAMEGEMRELRVRMDAMETT
jgi:hypothetical protein